MVVSHIIVVVVVVLVKLAEDYLQLQEVQKVEMVKNQIY